ncbi:MAG: hypothetical protein QOD99_1492 [Chthoniobacter sp.]|jgi:hypothetical protein|nr:hypothetical protein [Chthoniobacter sp.]
MRNSVLPRVGGAPSTVDSLTFFGPLLSKVLRSLWEREVNQRTRWQRQELPLASIQDPATTHRVRFSLLLPRIFFTLIVLAPALHADVPSGQYTILLSSSGSPRCDAGSGTLTVAADGSARVVLSSAEGKTFSGSGHLNDDGALAIVAKSGRETISGQLVFADMLDADCTGTLTRSRATSSSELQLIGSRFVPRVPYSLMWPARIISR